MEENALLPYIFYQLLEDMGGIVDLDANKVLESIKSKEDRGIAVSIIAGGTLRVELVEKDEDIDSHEH